MSIEETIFFIALITMITLTFIKLYNVLKSCTFYEKTPALILFIGSLLVWVISFICSMVDYNNTLLMQLQKVSNFMLGLNLFFGLIELLLYTTGAAVDYVKNNTLFRKRAQPVQNSKV